jgi:DNA primase
VKARTDLVALIGRDLDLRPSGSVLKARSPKHRDTDPSFVVFPNTQTWHDFSAGGSGGGDCLDYLVQHRGLGFMEALRTLAAETGVPMPGWTSEQAEAEAKRVVERRPHAVWLPKRTRQCSGPASAEVTRRPQLGSKEMVARH